MTDDEDDYMNRDWVLFNLREATEELAKTISEIEATQDYSDAEFSVAARHAYHHLNSAWNGRGASPERAAACSEKDFNVWRRFPSDLEMD